MEPIKVYVEELPFQECYKITVDFVYIEPEFSPVFIADTDPVETAVVKCKKRHYTVDLVLDTKWLVKEDLLWMKQAVFGRIKGDVYDKTNSIGVADSVARFVVDRLFLKNGFARPCRDRTTKAVRPMPLWPEQRRRS